MSDKAPITPKVLQWCRETAQMTLDVAASKIYTTAEKLKEWEEGVSQPTIAQAEKLAKLYRRPLSLLFLPVIPRDFMPLQDFRKPSAKPLGTASAFIIREVQQKQAWIKDIATENGEEALAFVGRFNMRSSPQTLAADILKTLEIDPSYYGKQSPILEWIRKAEAKGMYISRTSFIHSHLKLDSDELQGFAIADPHAPFIFINSDDWDAPQLFTLVHEIAHIWLAQSGISNDIQPELTHRDKLHPVELFCNEVAAAALMPVSVIKAINPVIFNDIAEVFNVAKRLGISSLALLYRCFSLNIISLDRYRKLKKDADIAFRSFEAEQIQKKQLQKEAGIAGGADYFLLLANRNGHHFSRRVIDAYREGIIQPTEASTLLNVKLNKLPKLELKII